MDVISHMSYVLSLLESAILLNEFKNSGKFKNVFSFEGKFSCKYVAPGLEKFEW